MNRNLFYICFMIGALILAAGCSKKEVQTVPDPGPQFSLQSFEVKVNDKENTAMPIRRDDPQSGPQIQIVTQNLQGLVASEKKLICGPLTIPGKKITGPEVGLLNFRVDDDEFKGLNKLPIRAPCMLQVTLTNNIGSTFTKTIPLVLRFDTNAPLEISRGRAQAGPVMTNGAFDFVIDTWTIHNTLPYPVGFSYSADRIGVGPLIYGLFVVKGFGQAFPLNQYLYTMADYTFAPSRIEVAGNVTNRAGDHVKDVGFVLPPDGAVTLSAWVHVPDWIPRQRGVPVAAMNPTQESHLNGVYLSSFSASGDGSLKQWHGFEPSLEDLKTPNVVTVPKERNLSGPFNSGFAALKILP